MPPPLRPVELDTDAQIDAAFDLMAHLRPHLRRESFVEQVRAQQKESGYRLAAGFTPENKLVVLAGYKPATTLARGPHLFVDDLVTAPDQQGKGYGKAMLAYLATRAQEMNLPTIWLDSRNTAKTFYEQVGFKVHTSAPCFIEVAALHPQPRSGDRGSRAAPRPHL